MNFIKLKNKILLWLWIMYLFVVRNSNTYYIARTMIQKDLRRSWKISGSVIFSRDMRLVILTVDVTTYEDSLYRNIWFVPEPVDMSDIHATMKQVSGNTANNFSPEYELEFRGQISNRFCKFLHRVYRDQTARTYGRKKLKEETTKAHAALNKL